MMNAFDLSSKYGFKDFAILFSKFSSVALTMIGMIFG